MTTAKDRGRGTRWGNQVVFGRCWTAPAPAVLNAESHGGGSLPIPVRSVPAAPLPNFLGG